MDVTESVAPHVEESTSLSDHEQQFGVPASTPAPSPAAVPDPDDAPDSERDATGRFKPRHKAQSQRATPADVDLINQYTKRLREAEDSLATELGVTSERQPGESERVYQLRRRAELAEKRRDALKTPPPPTAPVVPALPKREPPKPFTEREPQYEDFANEPDQYQAHLRALTAYDRRKEAAEREAQTFTSEQESAIKARNDARDQWFQTQQNKHYERMQAFHASNPQAQAILEQAGDIGITPAMWAAIITAENSPDLLMRVAQDDVLRDDLIDLTEGKPLSQDLVARVQRRLNRGRQAAETGSAAPPQPKSAPAVPRPPNPVRTGPQAPSDAPPSDEDSLAAHEKYYGGSRR